LVTYILSIPPRVGFVRMLYAQTPRYIHLYAIRLQLAAARMHTARTRARTRPDQGKSPNCARKTVSLIRPVAGTRPGTREPWTGNQNQQGGWPKEISFPIGGYRFFYICYPLVPYILQKFFRRGATTIIWAFLLGIFWVFKKKIPSECD